jgi:ABC-type lipoprotein release transport system permease subunit
MAFGKLWTIAYRDLGRNRRRSALSLIAVALGLGLLILGSGYIAGALEGSLQNNILMQTGHVQVRAESYEIENMSLLWSDLLENIDDLTLNIQQMEEVESATPVLWASGILSTVHDSSGLRVLGVDVDASYHDPVRQGMTAGEYLTTEDRDGVLISKRLADSMGIAVGQKVSLVVGNPEGKPDEGIFTIRGLYATGIASYDDNTLLMPISKAQAFTRTDGRASSIIVMLHDMDDADHMAEILLRPGLQALSWVGMNSVLLEAIQTGMSFYYLMYVIVMLIVAVIIANTLLMAVFERTREIGILGALGMKRRQILMMYLLEACALALMGILVGVLLGSAGVAYLAKVGIYLGEMSSVTGSAMSIGSTLYAQFVPGEIAVLSLATFLVIMLASLYPAWFATRLEPVEALHAH